MDTINNVANAAAKAVWGENESNKEPISGTSGDVSKGEPYDAGNLDESDQKKLSSEELSKNPAPQADTKPAPADTTAGQNDTREPENVDADEPAGDVTGPGPKSLDVVAKEHGGDAGNDATKAAATDGDDSAAKDAPADSGEQGTGEQYVKTSGLAADGGDFDATKPGAGREADRLMDQKGIHTGPAGGDAATKETAGDSSKPAPSSPDSSKKDKPSLGDRIKAKLHKH